VKLGAINRWLALVANIAVFASIVFLAIEVRQNQATLEESNRLSVLQARTIEIEQFNSFRSMVTQDPELSRIWFNGLADKNLDASDEARFKFLCENNIWISIGSFDRSTELNRPVVAQGTVQVRADMIDSSSRFRSCWIGHREMIRRYDMEDYVEAVEQLVKSHMSKPD
jgi:hypothetical protein